MSESSSIHSVKLVSLARSLSGLGLDAANGGPANPSDDNEPPPLVRRPLATHFQVLMSCSNISHLQPLLCVFLRSPASIWDLGFILLTAREKWTMPFATNTKKGGGPSHVCPLRPMEASPSRYWGDRNQKENPGRRAHP